jgi:hypothetical protein
MYQYLRFVKEYLATDHTAELSRHFQAVLRLKRLSHAAADTAGTTERSTSHPNLTPSKLSQLHPNFTNNTTNSPVQQTTANMFKALFGEVW